MKCYDWATEMRDNGVCVMGGFQSPLERDVLTFLLKGKQPVVWVLAHKLWTLWGQTLWGQTPKNARLLGFRAASGDCLKIRDERSDLSSRFLRH